MRYLFFIWLGILWGLQACSPSEPQAHVLEDSPYHLALPAGFPQPEIPDHNKLTTLRVEFGKRLFFDPALSLDSTISCGTCHLPQKAFTDANAVSVGIKGRKGFRNVPTLFNVAYHPYFFREGKNPSLEAQVMGPLENHDEMGFSGVYLPARLQQNEQYVKLAKVAYGRELDMYVVTRALAAYERTLLSGNSAYDRYRNGDETALSPSAKRGMNLFFSPKTRCMICHNGHDLTNYAIENIGSHATYEDPGLFRATSDPKDRGKFKVPTLRNIALTGPYMHDGSYETLEEIIELYNQGGKGHPNQAPQIGPLGLTKQEKADLLAFLESLTEEELVRKTGL
ncbi:MAG: cytochrome c peroxidase [Bacteroidota bacterium]